MRSQEKADFLAKAHPGAKLDFKIVEDIAKEGAFDEAVKIQGLEAVIHTASPFHFVSSRPTYGRGDRYGEEG